jgi:hypothetical protein
MTASPSRPDPFAHDPPGPVRLRLRFSLEAADPADPGEDGARPLWGTVVPVPVLVDAVVLVEPDVRSGGYVAHLLGEPGSDPGGYGWAAAAGWAVLDWLRGMAFGAPPHPALEDGRVRLPDPGPRRTGRRLPDSDPVPELEPDPDSERLSPQVRRVLRERLLPAAGSAQPGSEDGGADDEELPPVPAWVQRAHPSELPFGALRARLTAGHAHRPPAVPEPAPGSEPSVSPRV